MFNETDVLKIRDAVDLYLIGDDLIQVYFMNTRKRSQFKCNKFSILLLEHINGVDSIREIRDKLVNKIGQEIEISAIITIIKFLYSKGVIVENTPDLHRSYISDEDYERYDRQLNFFGDFLRGSVQKFEVQKKLQQSKILVFGCGAMGGWITTQLAMSGVRNFILFDSDVVEASDVSRHIFYKEKYIGEPKVAVLTDFLKQIDSNVEVERHQATLTPETDIEPLICAADFIINTADEPYIGYTSIKISRECVKQNKAHYIAGGFDAHLASTGEIIIPGITPCVDCYANHFKETLKGWKPKPHPVKERYTEIGGLSPMTLFSSSYAVIEIIKYIGGLVDFQKESKSRGEFLFDALTLNYLKVQRDKNCGTCGGIGID